MPEKLGTLKGSKILYDDLRGRIADEAEKRESADNNLSKSLQEYNEYNQQLLTKTKKDLEASINSLQSALEQEAITRGNADDAEANKRKTEDDKLQAAIDACNKALTTINASITSDLEKEIIARQQEDNKIYEKLNTEIIDRKTADASEADERKSADNELRQLINEETNRAQVAESTITTKVGRVQEQLSDDISAETAARIAADSSLATAIKTEQTAREAAITQEANKRSADDIVLGNRITNEISDRKSEDSNLSNSIDAVKQQFEASIAQEVASRKADDSLLKGEITKEQEARIATDNILQKAIDAEGSQRVEADNALRTSISNIQSKIPSAASSTNQLADKDFVNSSINNMVSFFRGSFSSYESLVNKPWQTTDPTADFYVHNNDYAYVESDETHNGEAWRYVYVEIGGGKSQWEAQFKINDSPFTQDQLNAINSGITSNAVSNISKNTADISNTNQKLISHINAINNPHSVTKEQLGLGNVDNTADIDKPISSATRVLIDNVSDTSLAHIASRDNPHNVTKQQIGLGNVNDTSDEDKPVSTAQREAINAVDKELQKHISNISNPHQVTKQQIGLGRVDNTADIEKPISQETQQVLDQKAPIYSPNFEGFPTAPTPADGASGTQVVNVDYVRNQVSSAGTVSFREKQNLTDQQKQTARDNIGAVESERSQSSRGFGIVRLDDGTQLPLNNKVYGMSTQQGTPAPDALVPINDVDVCTLYVTGENILPKGNNGTISGVTFTVNDDGSVSTSGVATDDIDYNIISAYYPVDVYTISGCPLGGGNLTYSVQFNLYKNNVYQTGIANYSTLDTSTFNTAQYEYDSCRVLIHIRKGIDVTGKVFYPQLEQGKTSTIYSPYKLQISYDVGPLRGLHIGSLLPAEVEASSSLMEGVYDIGQYDHDYYIADSAENSYSQANERSSKTAQRIKKFILTGEEDITYNTVTGGKERFQLTVTDAVSDNSKVLVKSNAFQAVSADNLLAHSTDNCIAVENAISKICISIYSTDYESAEDLKQYLQSCNTAGNPVYVYYVLSSPLINSDKDVYVESIEGTTMVFTDSKLSPYIETSYSVDIWTLLKQQSNRITDLGHVVTYDAQLVSEAQKMQARKNISAVGHISVNGIVQDNVDTNIDLEVVESVNGQTGNVTLDKSSVGLNKVDNTADIDKPISKAQAAAIKEVADKLNTKQNDAVYTVASIIASGWNNDEYSFETTYPASKYDLEVQIAPSATLAQYSAFSSGCICGNATTNILKALGTIPSIDIPIILKTQLKNI